MREPGGGREWIEGATRLDRAPVQGLGSRPILVTGAHRSGTSWIGSMLAAASAPTVVQIVEPFNLERPIGLCPERPPHWFGYVTTATDRDLRRAMERTLDFRYATVRELVGVRTPRSAARLARDRYRFHRARTIAARPLMKDPIAVLSAEWLVDTFGMDAVVSIRHPAGFAASVARLNWRHPFDHFLAQPALMRDHLAPFEDEIAWYTAHERPVLEQAALLWKLIYTVVDGYRERRPGWVFVRLEDLAAAPLHRFADLYRNTGLRFDEYAEAAILASSSDANPGVTPGPSVIDRNSVAAVQAWRTQLEPRDAATVRAIVGPLADRFYPDDGRAERG
jgi:Sulfotransferase family